MTFQKYRTSHLPFATKIQREGLALLRLMIATQPWSILRNTALKLTPSGVFTNYLLDAGQKDLMN